jgi:AhpD family alkylhydroperoxidase
MKIKFGRKLYSIKEIYWIFYRGMRTVGYLSKSKKNNEINQNFIERIMLAVTEVNGCEVCSYAHTKMALESGMSNEEIQKMLSGIVSDIPDEELSAVMFAQYYADSRGKPSEDSWKQLIQVYGLAKAKGIFGAVCVIMIGNAYGIAWSSFHKRFKGEADKRSNLLYEIGVIIFGTLLVPFAIVNALISNLIRVPIIRF